MKNLILSLFIVISAMSCEKKSTENVNTETYLPDSVTIPETNEPIEPSTLQTCYVAEIGKDSVFVTLDDNLGTITGKMRYKNFEKDSSFGDVVGSQNGDTIKINYTFQAEGATSDREISFLKKDGNLIEGISEQKTEGNKSIYTDSKKIKYETGLTLKPVDCKNFERNFAVK